MDVVLQTIGKQIYHDGNHFGFLVKWKLIVPLVKKWSRNREPDMERVQEMLDFHVKGGYIPKLIHLAELQDEGLICYDGNHRREVLNRSDCNVECIVDVMFGASPRDVYIAFNNINKSIQLPAIYLEDVHDDASIRNDIIALVKTYERDYKSFLSTSSRCHSPNFNRDTFVDNVHNLYKSFNKTLTIAQIAVLLKKLNEKYAQGELCRPHSLYKSHVIDKCKKNGLWLFLERYVPFEHVECITKLP